MPKSVLFVPLVTGGRATGVISLDNFDREHAFDDADVRLLTTLAGSLSVALENARLVHETRQRNAELALINSVQEALAGELELQAIYDAVGDKIREIFDAQVVDIAIYDEASGLTPLPVPDRARRAACRTSRSRCSASAKHVLETRAPLLINEITPRSAERLRQPAVLSGETPKSVLWRAAHLGGGKPTRRDLPRRTSTGARLHRVRPALAGDARGQPERGARERAARARDAAAERRAGADQQRAGRDRGRARARRRSTTPSATGSGRSSTRRSSRSPCSTKRPASSLPVHHRARRAAASRAASRRAASTKHVLETRESLLIDENIEAEAERYGSPTIAGEDRSRPCSSRSSPAAGRRA